MAPEAPALARSMFSSFDVDKLTRFDATLRRIDAVLLGGLYDAGAAEPSAMRRPAMGNAVDP